MPTCRRTCRRGQPNQSATASPRVASADRPETANTGSWRPHNASAAHCPEARLALSASVGMRARAKHRPGRTHHARVRLTDGQVSESIPNSDRPTVRCPSKSQSADAGTPSRRCHVRDAS